MPNASALTSTVASLLAADTPVTFYDVAVVVRALGAEDPPDALLTSLVKLHEAAHLTDGARGVLEQYLRTRAARHAAERELAREPLGPKAHGRTIRAKRGTTITVVLEDTKEHHWE